MNALFAKGYGKGLIRRIPASKGRQLRDVGHVGPWPDCSPEAGAHFVRRASLPLRAGQGQLV